MNNDYPDSFLPSIVQYKKSMEFSPTFLNAKKFEILWKTMNTSLYVDVWKGEPIKTWFHGKKFITSDVKIGIKDGRGIIHFHNGRHRTRWLIAFGQNEIAVGLDSKGFDNAVKLGLEPRRIQYES